MASELWNGFAEVVTDVALAIVPLAAVAVFFNLIFLRLPRSQFRAVLAGLALTALGTIFFLYGVRIGFMPAGQTIGKLVAASRPSLLVPIGFVLGLVAVLAEPTVRVQTAEVARVSGGAIPERLLTYALALGVGIAVALAMLRVWLDVHLLAILIPGYALAFLLMFLVSPGFTSIAFDSGSVATGPVTVTFILSVALGAAAGMPGTDPVVAGFGLVAIVGLAPVLAVLAVGVLYARAEPLEEDTEGETDAAGENTEAEAAPAGEAAWRKPEPAGEHKTEETGAEAQIPPGDALREVDRKQKSSRGAAPRPDGSAAASRGAEACGDEGSREEQSDKDQVDARPSDRDRSGENRSDEDSSAQARSAADGSREHERDAYAQDDEKDMPRRDGREEGVPVDDKSKEVEGR